MLIPDDLAASVPHVISDGVVMPTSCRLSGTAERKHHEHFIDQVEHAPLPKTGTEDLPPPAAASL